MGEVSGASGGARARLGGVVVGGAGAGERRVGVAAGSAFAARLGRGEVGSPVQGVSLQLLWQEFRGAHAGEATFRYAQFCEHYRAYKGTLRRSMR